MTQEKYIAPEQLQKAHAEYMEGASMESLCRRLQIGETGLRRRFVLAGLATSRKESLVRSADRIGWDEGISNKFLIMKLRQA